MLNTYPQKILEIINETGPFKLYLSYFISKLLKRWDLKNIQKLIENHTELMQIFTEAEYEYIIFGNFNFKHSEIEEVRYLFDIFPVAEEIFNNNYSKDKRGHILSRDN